MNTLHFKYAVEIEKTHSITQAAENLFMAQPNLSKAIKELENTLGITIFRRTSKGVIPTEQGLKFLSYAKQVLIQIDNMEAIHSPGKAQRQKLKISAPRAHYISKALSDFIGSFDSTDNMEVYLRETNSIQTIADIREQCYDFGVIRFSMEHEKYFMDYLSEKSLEAQILWDFEMTAVMSAIHPFADREVQDYQELSQFSVEILYGDGMVPYISQTSMGVKKVDESADLLSKKLYVFDRGSMLDALNSIKYSFALVSPVESAELEKYGIVKRSCNFAGNRYRDLIVYSSGHTLSAAELMLMNKLYAARNEAMFKL